MQTWQIFTRRYCTGLSMAKDPTRVMRRPSDDGAVAIEGDQPLTLPCHKHNTRLDSHSSRIEALERKKEEHDAALHAGDVSFVELRKDFAHLSVSVEKTNKILERIAWILVAFVIAAVLNVAMPTRSSSIPAIPAQPPVVRP
jgi:hypothetical protein